MILDEELYKEDNENISIYNIPCKTSTALKPLRIRFDKLDECIKIHHKIRYLILFDYVWFDKICDKIKYLIGKKNGITDSINHNFTRIRIDLYNSLPIKKILTFHNVIILIRSVAKRNKNEYYYNIFLEKSLYKDKSYAEHF